jgi:hypothetical protein
MNEQRQSIRKKSFLRGCVYFNKRHNMVDCLIRDISDDGARIIFSDGVNLPDQVELHIPQKGQTFSAEVQWRQRDEVGLAFARPDQSTGTAADAGDLARRVTHLETEVLALKRMLKRLKTEVDGGGDDAA